HVANALETYETNRNTRNGNGNGSGSQSDGRSGSRRTVHTARGCTYKEFLNYQPLTFKSIKGTAGLARWFKKMESIFHISNCDVESYEMSLKDLMKMMTEANCLRNEIQKLESEFWYLMVKGTDVVAIQNGNVTLSKLTRLEEAIQIANSLMDQKVRAYAARQADNKRRMDNNPRDNHA
nr:hypothetical protein [Tanacetum cinerariifolium]